MRYFFYTLMCSQSLYKQYRLARLQLKFIQRHFNEHQLCGLILFFMGREFRICFLVRIVLITDSTQIPCVGRGWWGNILILSRVLGRRRVPSIVFRHASSKLGILEGTACYVGQLLDPTESFGLWRMFFCPLKKTLVAKFRDVFAFVFIRNNLLLWEKT